MFECEKGAGISGDDLVGALSRKPRNVSFKMDRGDGKGEKKRRGHSPPGRRSDPAGNWDRSTH